MCNDIISSELEELGKLTMILDQDVKVAFERLLAHKSDFDLRVFVRIVYSGIEGYLYFLRQMCLERHNRNQIRYEPHEIMALKEERSQINNNGSVDTKEDWMQFEKAIRFTFKYAFKDVAGLPKVDYNSEGWNKLIQGQRVRNRLTHPKNAGLMGISKDDYISVMEGFLWFRKVLDDNFKQALAALQNEHDQLIKLLDDDKNAT